MNIILFPQTDRVVIRIGRANETRIENSSGTTIERHDPPVRVFLIDYEDREGGITCVWDGETHAEPHHRAYPQIADGWRKPRR